MTAGSTNVFRHQADASKLFVFTRLGFLWRPQFFNSESMAFKLPKGKPKNGNLIQVLPSGATTTLVSNRPFAELQIVLSASLPIEIIWKKNQKEFINKNTKENYQFNF